MNKSSWPQVLEKILEGNHLSESEAIDLMSGWLKEDLSPVQTGAFLASLRAKNITGTELAAMAKVLRDACPLPCTIPSLQMVDTCGTGGDGANTFNISTAVAFTSAACGVNVAKHGNRSASGKVGSADVLEELGITLNSPLESVVAAISKVKVTFLFAPMWHPSLVNLAPLRKSLGIRTIFNLLGPLVNPLRPQAQVLGVAKAELLDPMAEALQKLGLKRAVVVHGSGGLDEASLEGANQLRFLTDTGVKNSSFEASSLGLHSASIDSLRGGGVLENKDILTSVLKGTASRPQLEVVALNTALVLWASGAEENLKSGIGKALECLDSGLPWKILEDLKDFLKADSN